MGNSNGSLDEYLDLFWREPAIAGGYIWDWRDQGLAELDDEGRFYWAYGGHFGDEPNDANFCINGLVGPDLVPHPVMRELAWGVRTGHRPSTSAGKSRPKLTQPASPSPRTDDLQLRWTDSRSTVKRIGSRHDGRSTSPPVAREDGVGSVRDEAALTAKRTC